MMKFLIVVSVCLAITGCSTLRGSSDAQAQPESGVCELCAAGKYHAAMRALPEAMRYWEEYTKRTGETAEGAAGFEYGTVMFKTAQKGDADWGKILDDPDIPYEYKTWMVFEILEARLGKWSVYFGNEDNLIVPSKRPLRGEAERIELPEK